MLFYYYLFTYFNGQKTNKSKQGLNLEISLTFSEDWAKKKTMLEIGWSEALFRIWLSY